MNIAAVDTPPSARAMPVERRPAFAFAKRHGVLVNRVVDGIAQCACRENASPLAIAEVRRAVPAHATHARSGSGSGV